jgi:hypothetical protein
MFINFITFLSIFADNRNTDFRHGTPEPYISSKGDKYKATLHPSCSKFYDGNPSSGSWPALSGNNVGQSSDSTSTYCQNCGYKSMQTRYTHEKKLHCDGCYQEFQLRGERLRMTAAEGINNELAVEREEEAKEKDAEAADRMKTAIKVKGPTICAESLAREEEEAQRIIAEQTRIIADLEAVRKVGEAAQLPKDKKPEGCNERDAACHSASVVAKVDMSLVEELILQELEVHRKKEAEVHSIIAQNQCSTTENEAARKDEESELLRQVKAMAAHLKKEEARLEETAEANRLANLVALQREKARLHEEARLKATVVVREARKLAEERTRREAEAYNTLTEKQSLIETSEALRKAEAELLSEIAKAEAHHITKYQHTKKAYNKDTGNMNAKNQGDEHIRLQTLRAEKAELSQSKVAPEAIRIKHQGIEQLREEFPTKGEAVKEKAPVKETLVSSAATTAMIQAKQEEIPRLRAEYEIEMIQREIRRQFLKNMVNPLVSENGVGDRQGDLKSVDEKI